MTLILSWIVLNSGGIDEGLYAPLSVIALCLGAAAGGAISAKGCGNKLLVTGLITGAAVYLIITAISCAMGAVPQTAGLFRIPAAVLYTAGCLSAIISGLRRRSSVDSQDKQEHSRVIAAFAALGYLISSLFGVAMFYTVPYLFIFMGLAASFDSKP